MAGYKTEYGISPEIGVRYTNIKLNQNSEYLKKSKSDFYSVVVGVNYERSVWDFILGGSVMIEYDVMQLDSNIDLDVLGYKYNFTIEDKERPLGAEFGLWTSYSIGGVDLRLKYDARLRSDFINHTGMLSIKCAF